MPYGAPAVDNTTIELAGGKMAVKDAGIDAGKLAAAESLLINATDFTIAHNEKPVVLLTLDGVFQNYISSTSLAIADGSLDGL